jgi:hypothetical protein
MTPSNQSAPAADQSVATDGQVGALNNSSPTGKFLAETGNITGIPKSTDVPKAFPAALNLLKSAVSQSPVLLAMSGASFASSAASAGDCSNQRYNDDDDDDIGATGDDEDGGEDGDDDGGGNTWIANLFSQIPLLGGLLGMFGGLMSRSRASGGGCNGGGDCSQRMSLRSRVPSLSNRAASPGYGTPLAILRPGFGPLGGNKSA